MQNILNKDAITLAHVMQPSDANPIGNVHGGTILKLIDSAYLTFVALDEKAVRTKFRL